MRDNEVTTEVTDGSGETVTTTVTDGKGETATDTTDGKGPISPGTPPPVPK